MRKPAGAIELKTTLNRSHFQQHQHACAVQLSLEVSRCRLAYSTVYMITPTSELVSRGSVTEQPMYKWLQLKKEKEALGKLKKYPRCFFLK